MILANAIAELAKPIDKGDDDAIATRIQLAIYGRENSLVDRNGFLWERDSYVKER